MRRTRLMLTLVGAMLLSGLLVFIWGPQSGSSEPQSGAMHNCAPAGKWSIAVWDGDSGTAPDDALATCGPGSVDAAYSLDPLTQAWSRWFAARPELNNMPDMNYLDGLIAMGSAAGPAATTTPSPTVTATPTPTPPVAGPQVRVETVAEDDEVRNEGMMVICPGIPPFPPGDSRATDADTCNDDNDDIWEDLHASYKLSVTYEGVPVEATIFCMVAQKKAVSPSVPEFSEEVIATEASDVSERFVCMSRPVAPGVGVLDVYYMGPLNAEAIGAYELVVQAAYTVGSKVYFGTDVQDLCVLGWPFNDNGANKTFSVDASTADGLRHLKRAPHPLDNFVGCEDAALFQRQLLGLGIP
jgi:hypothetical protein